MKNKISKLKMWPIILSVVFAVALLACGILYYSWEPAECCLCSSFRYHAPCLIDLETGAMTELNLYLPHETKAAELADEQPEQGIFSLVLLGNASGYRDTSRERAQADIPIADKTFHPALCKECKKKLDIGYFGRYVLADLYDYSNKKLFPIASGMALELRCYTVMANKTGNGTLQLTVQGNLEG